MTDPFTVSADEPLPSEPLDLLKAARSIAVVGFSDDPSKPAHSAAMELVHRGWHVHPVNPNHEKINGLQCYARISDIPEQVDIVDVFRPASDAPAVTQAAIDAGARAVWIQLGIVSGEARQLAADAGIAYVEDTCAGALARRNDLHAPGRAGG